MNIRKLKQEELLAAEALESLSFVFPLADDREKELETEEYKPDRWGCFDDNGMLTTTLTNHNLPVWLDGQAAAARGVGGVVSDPVSRGQGHVRAMFKHVLQADRAEGMLFSVLYPFSHAFYRKFGYELCHEQMKARFPTEALKVFRTSNPPQARLLTPDDNPASLQPVYDAFAKQYSFMAARNEHTWGRIEIEDPRKAKRYWYALSRNGKDTAYATFFYRPSSKPYVRTLCLREYAFADRRAFADLMAFLHRFAAQAKDIEMYLPANIPLASLLDDCYAVEQNIANKPMARALHVAHVLQAMRHPKENGTYSVFVEDAFLPENTGCYIVKYAENGEVNVTQSKRENADLRVSIHTFTQLVFGFLRLDEAQYKPDVQISDNEAILQKVFVNKMLFLNDFY